MIDLVSFCMGCIAVGCLWELSVVVEAILDKRAERLRKAGRGVRRQANEKNND